MISVIERAVALAKHIPPEKIKKSSMELTLVSSQMERGSAVLGNLLGIEEASRPKIENGLAVLKREQTELQNRVNFGTRYHLLSMEPLTWRDKNGWPRLIVFNLDSPKYEIEVVYLIDESDWRKRTVSQTARFASQECLVERRNGTRTTTKYERRVLPKAITSCYSDVLAKLEGMARDHKKSLNLSSRFEGLIPEEVKRKIAEARGSFREIFIIAEPKEFQITESDVVILRPPLPEPSPDPLVVGFDGSQLWLIADFETTPVEEAMIFSLPRVSRN